jgi:lysophospholipase L1-like esterase
MFGKWFFWKDYAAHSYAIDDFKLEAKVEIDTNDYKPAGAPLARVLEKLKKGEPITIVTIGDSLTDFAHWANKPINWPTTLADKLKTEFKSEVKIVNPAIGGTLLKHGMVIIPRWVKPVPEPDLITICYGFNDDDSGMTGPQFLAAQKDAIERVRRATKGKSDVLIITTNPAVPKWDKLAGLAESCRQAAKEKNAGIADTYVAFHEAGKENKERLFCSDTVHMGKDGHELIAETVLKAIKNAGK